MESARRRAEKHPEKRYATGVVARSIKSGKLKRQHCEVCGSENVQAHHEDYSKPLEVRWLCFKHHRQLHGQVNV